jgi:hypothetical protein
MPLSLGEKFMSNEDQKKKDLSGVPSSGEALNTVAKETVDSASAFLRGICLPAAEEFGLLLRDKVSDWRAKNALEITREAEAILAGKGVENVHAHPRIVMNILTEGSWSDDSQVKSFWAGLLASSCTEDGKDESNVIFLHILSQITSLQAKVLEHCCTHSTIKISEYGCVYAEFPLKIIDDLFVIAQTGDLQRIDRELDHLNSLQLIGGGIEGGIGMTTNKANITPTPLALQLYARCKGHSGPLEEFYKTEKEGNPMIGYGSPG